MTQLKDPDEEPNYPRKTHLSTRTWRAIGWVMIVWLVVLALVLLLT